MQIEVLGERYQLQDPIGRGGMATIYRGWDPSMDRTVAIKVLREVYSTDPKFVTRFQREANAASALQHPNIVQVYDYGQTDGNYFIVMELIEGADLRRYLRSRGTIEVERAVAVAHDVALGLGAAHRLGIVHRDVKPQNILVGRDGSIKLTDFGIASVYKDINAERLTTTGMTLGTVQYYAPEQAQGEIVSPAADVYALGIVMYEMLTGRPPFDGDTPVAVAMQHIQDPPPPLRQFNPHIPPALERIILRCLEKMPNMRYQDGNELARALEAFEQGGNVEPVAAGLLQASAPTIANQTAYANSNRRATAQLDPPYNTGMLPYGQLTPLGVAGENTPRPGVVEEEQRGSRSLMLVLLLLGALFLLSLSGYLAYAVVIGHLPFLGSPNPTLTIPDVQVPNLINKTCQDARTTAGTAGFTLQSQGDSTGIVTSQAPQSNQKARKGSQMQIQCKLATQNISVPDVVGKTLTDARNILLQAGLTFNIVNNGNIILREDPPSGTSIKPGTPVTLYTNSVISVPTATAKPLPTATPVPKKPTPTPTKIPPTATPIPPTATNPPA